MRILLLKKFILISDNEIWHTATLRLAGIAEMRGLSHLQKEKFKFSSYQSVEYCVIKE